MNSHAERDDSDDSKTSTEDDAPGSSGDAGSFPGEEGHAWLGGQRPLTSEEWNLLRAPFSRDAYLVGSRATGRTPANLAREDDEARAVVDMYLRPEAIRGRLDWVIGPERYSYRFEPGPQAGGRHSLFCHLRIGDAVRTGTGTGSNLRRARRIALASAAPGFGIGASGHVAGPIAAEKETRSYVPDAVLEALEEQREPSFWAPGGEPPEDASPADAVA